jgi:hypothetical protein
MLVPCTSCGQTGLFCCLRLSIGGMFVRPVCTPESPLARCLEQESVVIQGWLSADVQHCERDPCTATNNSMSITMHPSVLGVHRWTTC